MKKIKYIALFTTSILSFVSIILTFYYAFFAKSDSVMRIYQFMAALIETNEEVMAFIENSIPQYTMCFIILFVFSIIIFVIALTALILTLKKEQPIKEWIENRKAIMSQCKTEKNQKRIRKLQSKLESLKKDGE